MRWQYRLGRTNLSKFGFDFLGIYLFQNVVNKWFSVKAKHSITSLPQACFEKGSWPKLSRSMTRSCSKVWGMLCFFHQPFSGISCSSRTNPQREFSQRCNFPRATTQTAYVRLSGHPSRNFFLTKWGQAVSGENDLRALQNLLMLILPQLLTNCFKMLLMLQATGEHQNSDGNKLLFWKEERTCFWP